MIYSLINEFVIERLGALQSGFDTELQLKEIPLDIEVDKIPASHSTLHYLLTISGVNKVRNESNVFLLVNCNLQFVFLTAKKNNSYLRILFDKYVYGLFRIMNEMFGSAQVTYDSDLSQSITINEITEISIETADTKAGEYYTPSIAFTLSVIDNTNIGGITLSTENLL